MISKYEIDNDNYFCDFSKPLSLAIPLVFNGEQPSSYGVPKAVSNAYEDGNFIGDVRRGGSCNFETIEMTPHCNGTHTECVGHITKERVSIAESLKERISKCVVISVEPTGFSGTSEKYNETKKDDDLVITREQLKEILKEYDSFEYNSLAIRTIPNSESKKTGDYSELPAYFTKDAMEYIFELGIDNLLVDLPSIDRLYDEGKMTNHRTFWQVDEDRNINKSTLHKTITEFIFVEDEIKDGYYILDLQIPPFVSDAAPSTPILYKLEKQ